MGANYWQKSLSARLSRRRALAATGATGLGSALLAACGGGDDRDSNSDQLASSLLSKAVDTSKDAKRGGILKLSNSGDVPSLDVQQNYTTNGFFWSTAARLVEIKPGYLKSIAEEPDPNIAESWEFSPDRLQLTLKLRPGVKWHNLAPVNGRVLDVDDILFTWKRFSTTGGNRAALAYEVNPEAPFVSYSAPDARTIVIKLSRPYFYAVSLLAASGMYIMPKEGENPSVVDLRRTIIGTGPYYLAEYQPSVGITLKRHLEYWRKDRPFADQVNYPIVPEYATALAQFRTGSIYSYTVRQEDLLSTKQSVPELSMYDTGVTPHGNKTIFGWRTVPFRDERVRQAMSMSWDRDLWIDVFYNADKYTAEGLTVERRWNTALTTTESDADDNWWVDPKGKDFGANAKYYKQDLAEARKLMAAAGYAGGFNATLHMPVGGGYEQNAKHMEVLTGFEKELGIRYTARTIDYNTEFLNNFRDSIGDFEGITYKAGPSPISNDPVARLAFDYYSKGGRTWFGFDMDGKGDFSGDNYLDTEIGKLQSELDANKRRTVVHELQRYISKKQYALRWPGGATSFSLAWPVLGNFQVWRTGGPLVNTMNWWVDETKAPIRKA